MIDLDGFKNVNDRFGHNAGDDFLRHVGTSLREAVRAGDLIARFGGDEFLVLLERTSEEAAVKVAQSMLKSLSGSDFFWTGQALKARASLGVGMGSYKDATWVSCLERADIACYEAKSSGGNVVKVFRSDGTMPTRKTGTHRALTTSLPLTANRTRASFVLRGDQRAFPISLWVETHLPDS